MAKEIPNSLFFLLVVLLGFFAPSAVPSPTSRFQAYLQIDTSHPNPDYPTAISFLVNQTQTLLPHLSHRLLNLAPDKPILLFKWIGRNPSLPSILLNSHIDVVPAEIKKWSHPPFSAHLSPDGRIFARGSQDMKSVGMQYLEALKTLSDDGYVPDRTVWVSFVPDEEIGGVDGVGRLVDWVGFEEEMNVGFVLDEGLANEGEEFRLFYGERSPWWLIVKAVGLPGHGSKLFDGSAMENLMKSIEIIMRFRKAQFQMFRSGVKKEGEVISVNMVYLKAGTPTIMNLQPSEAEAGFDIRVTPNTDINALEKRIQEEWAPSSRNMSFEFIQKILPITTANRFNPWYTLLVDAVEKVNGKLGEPEIFPASTDSRFFRERGIPAIGFSPMSRTPILLHDHNEVLDS